MAPGLQKEIQNVTGLGNCFWPAGGGNGKEFAFDDALPFPQQFCIGLDPGDRPAISVAFYSLRPFPLISYPFLRPTPFD
jgi:hypothetical protein